VLISATCRACDDRISIAALFRRYSAFLAIVSRKFTLLISEWVESAFHELLLFYHRVNHQLLSAKLHQDEVTLSELIKDLRLIA
jgi:hypothetical protein